MANLKIRNLYYKWFVQRLERPCALPPGNRTKEATELLRKYEKVLKIWNGKQRPRVVEEALVLAELLMNQGLFFGCHEFLEEFWRPAAGEKRLAVHGIIQFAAAFHKLELNPGAVAGACELLEKASAKLGATGALGPGVGPALADQADDCRRALAQGTLDPLSAARHLNWTGRWSV